MRQEIIERKEKRDKRQETREDKRRQRQEVMEIIDEFYEQMSSFIFQAHITHKKIQRVTGPMREGLVVDSPRFFFHLDGCTIGGAWRTRE